MNILNHDLRYGWRMMVKYPGFTLIAVLTLAIGIGANTAIFTVVNAALLRGLPYHEPERLVHLWERTERQNFQQREASYPDFLDWRQNQVFAGMAAYSGGGAVVMAGREANEMIEAGRVSADFFDVLGVRPLLGRAFAAGEDQRGAAQVVLLSYGLWRRQFGGDAKIIGQTITLSGQPYTVIGVLPAQFQFAPRGAAGLWIPLIPTEAQASRRYMHWVNVIARLKPGVSSEQATAAMQTIAGRIAQDHAESHAGTSLKIISLQEQFTGQVRQLLLVLLGAVGFVLLIVCANLASLLLVRAASRQKELAVRAALGAGRRQIISQLLTESLLLTLPGGLAGLLLARWGVDGLIAAIPDDLLNFMPYLRGLTLDGRVLIFTAAISLLTGIVFGLAPALNTSRPDLQHALREGGRTSASGGSHRMRNLLVVTEIALAVVLLVGAGLMTKSLLRLMQVDPGFDPKNLLTFKLRLPAARYDSLEKIAAANRQLLARLEAMPGVKGAATVSVAPLIGGNTTRFYVAGQPKPAPGGDTEANLRDISANYFSVMGVPLIGGRFFTARDDVKAPPVIIVNQTLARMAFGNQEAVGQRLIFTGNDPTPVQIVGVVGDERVNGLDAAITPVVYFPDLQDTSPGLTISAVVRGTTDAGGLLNAVRRECQAFESGAVMFDALTMERIMANSPATFLRRYPALLIGLFAVIALLLAAVGIYGVVSWTVTQQTHDIGIRMALGAQSRDILKLVMGQGLALTGCGLLTGLVSSVALMRLLSGLLFGINATDPPTLGLIAALLSGVALTACWLPARRALRTDPLIALRAE